jgi:hypothetical protein
LKEGPFIMHCPFLLVPILLEEYLGVKASLRVAFFVWMTTLGKIFTLDNLRKKRHSGGLVLLFKRSVIDHPLLHCEVARELWVLIFHLV